MAMTNSDIAEWMRMYARTSDTIIEEERVALYAAVDKLLSIDAAVEQLVLAMRLYPNYRLDSRGPCGCIASAIEKLAPDVLAEVRDSDWRVVHEKRWGS